jgi:YD repeat-containing protein
VKRYDVTDISQFTISSLKYNTAGAVVLATDPLSHSATVSYVDSFSDGNNGRNTLAYPKTITDADGYSSTLIYNFDFGAVTSKQTPQPNTIENVPGPVQTLTYDAAGRTEKVTSTTNGAYVKYVYGPNYLLTLSTVNIVADEAYSNTVFDGMGRTVVAARNHPGSLGGYRAVNTIYDLMGRAVKQSNPTETNDAWLPAGDDAAGWLYAQQTYDWRARPLVTTNTDLTTREASYAGCGCAGGEVVTLTDEGTIDGGVPKRRQQKIYSDVLGRTVKTEVLNWDGAGNSGTDGSVYSTTVNTYNARDQLTRVRQFDAAQGTVPSDPNDFSCPTGSCQQTTMTYDGYGRSKTKHAPEQDEGTATTWNYNADDTVQSVTDARGASQTFTYNNRRLVKDISYSAPAGINSTAPVSYDYDAAANRTSMTDGMGSMSYSYDQLSRLTSETRTLTGIGTYPLSYAYNLANQLTSITDPFSAQVGYNHDLAGRLSSITGSGYANVSTYASNLQYRAWGAIKALTYGNNYTLSMSYNARLQGTQFEVAGRPPQYGSSTVMKTQQQYYADGRLKFADDLLDERFDRAYSYEQVERLQEAYTGSEARDFINQTSSGTATGPYRQSYAYDVWSDPTSRVARFWSRSSTFTASYSNGRNTGSLWQYDADGRLVREPTVRYDFDAAGRNVTTSSIIVNSYTGGSVSQSGDGDGMTLKRVETQQDVTTTSYQVRSSVLGGRVVTELSASGQKLKTHVYAGKQQLAEQADGIVTWQHSNPFSGSEGIAYSTGLYAADTEPDPLGANVGFEDPYLYFEEPRPDSIQLLGGNSNGQCMLEGMTFDCMSVQRLLELGAAAECPDNDCGPRYNPNRDGPSRGGWQIPIFAGAGFLYGSLGPSNPPPGSEPPILKTGSSAQTNPAGYGFQFTEDGDAEGPNSSGDSIIPVNYLPFPQNPGHVNEIERLNALVDAHYTDCARRLGNSPAPSQDATKSILSTSLLEGTAATLLAVTWTSESGFNFYPDSNPDGGGVGDADIGPMQIDYNTFHAWSGLAGLDVGEVYGTTTTGRQRFNGNPYTNLRAAARILNAEGRGRNAAGRYRVGSGPHSRTPQGRRDFQTRAREYDTLAPGYDAFFDCLRRGGR